MCQLLVFKSQKVLLVFITFEFLLIRRKNFEKTFKSKAVNYQSDLCSEVKVLTFADRGSLTAQITVTVKSLISPALISV